MEPCSHHGSTPPCVDAVLGGRDNARRRGLARSRAGARRRPRAARARPASRRSWSTRSRRGGRTRRGGRGRLRAVRSSRTRSRSRSTAASRCQAPAGSPARRAAGSSTSSAPRPTPSRSGWERCARTIRGSTRAAWTAPRQPRRLAFGKGPLPEGSELELVTGPLEERAGAARRQEGVQSLLLEGGPTLATAFLEAGLVDKLLVFVAPVMGGAGPRFLGDLSRPVPLYHLDMRPVGKDILLTAYVHEP